ncbi:formate hydrogenlyase, partial [Candidatus Gracilibacteria bacterium]|nr:formate hydrogenlyase [Candidatus Gracilibacteria bacterium]
AMDNATYFGGLGVEREFFVMALVEPILILVIATLAFLFGTTDLTNIHTQILSLNFSFIVGFILIVLAIIAFYVLLAENKRFPFDNPATHLELTMIHEAMLLETNAKHLALMELSSKIKLVTFFSLFIYIFIPFTFGITSVIGLFILWFIKALFMAFIIGTWEIFIVKIRIFKYQNVFIFLFLLNIFLLIFYILK